MPQGLVGSARPRSALFVDAAIAVAILGATLTLLSHGGLGAATGAPGQLNWISGFLAACSVLPFLVWRRSPILVFVATAVASIVLAALGYSLGLQFGPTAALYLLAASRDEPTPWTRNTTGVVIACFAGYLTATAAAQGGLPGLEILHTSLAWSVAWFAGERTRLRREHIAELHERADRAERDAERDRLLAVAEERARIARDLHDSAGHAINVIVVRAGAARLRHGENPDRSLAALETIEEIARHTAADIDQIVGVLRDQNGPTDTVEAPPGLASLDTLVAHHVATGLDVTLRTTGMPQELGATVDQAAYRILQEALTNASRHGTGTARLDLAFGDAALDVTVANPVAPTPGPTCSGGHGLVGMRERAVLIGGTLQDERVNDTFYVRAHLGYGGRRR
jgi:signal transduction histidine kinase